MARAPVHLRKSSLTKGERGRLPASDFVFPRERRFPIHDLFHGRLALIYVMSPSHAESRDAVVKAVLRRYPELRSFWSSRMERAERRRLRPTAKRAVARPAARRPVAPTARRRARTTTNPHEDFMPVYVLNPHLANMRENPLAYDETPVILVGKPRRRLLRARTPGKPGRRSERVTLPSSETHALNPETGAAFCRAGISRKTKKVVPGMIHPTDKKVVTCMRCIKIITMNTVDLSVPGVPRKGMGIIERELKPSSPKKREAHAMIRGGEQGRFVSGSGKHISTGKQYRAYRERTRETGGPLYRGTEGIADFDKYVGWMGRPTQTIGEKRGRIMSERVSAAEARRRAAAEAAYAETGMAERIAAMEPYVGAEEQFEARRRAATAAKRRETVAARRAREEAARADRAAAVAGIGRGAGSAEEYMDNPRRRRGGRAAQAAGLRKGQGLMQQAAAAYRAGKYPTMQAALRGVARKNPLSEDGMVVNPKKRGGSVAREVVVVEKKSGFYVVVLFRDAETARGAKRFDLEAYADWTVDGNEAEAGPMARRSAARDVAEQVAGLYGVRIRTLKIAPSERLKKIEARMRKNPLSEDGMVVNPRRKGKSRKSGRTAAQSDAARAMSLFRSGKADTLAEAWSMVKRGR